MSRPSLTDVLMRTMARWIGALMALGTVGAVVAGGLGAGVAFALGAGLVWANGAGLTMLIGRWLDPESGDGPKGFLVFLLFAKLGGVALALWLALAVWNLPGLAVVGGLGTGLIGLLAGLHFGSTSKEGQAAMSAAEQKISEEREDSHDQTR